MKRNIEIKLDKKPKNDVIFKNLFSKNGNEDMLKEFLEAIMKIEVEELEIQKEVELHKSHVQERCGRLDLKVIINKTIVAIIEMQMKNNCDMEKRALYYAGKLLGSSLKTGEGYDKIKQVYIISILNESRRKLKRYCTDTVTVDSKYREYEVVNGIKYIFIDLQKFRKEVKEPKTKLEEWLTFIDYEKEEMIDMAIAQNRLVEKAEKEYEYLTGDEATRRWQELREKAERDEISAYDTGKSDGEKIRYKTWYKKWKIRNSKGYD